MLNEKNTVQPVSWVWSSDLFDPLFLKLFSNLRFCQETVHEDCQYILA